ncbi:MAG: dihydrofolate reductase family protein [Mycobacteriaceae bacterium]|nr:dihydrofolate reductase family protein [Mycobacteriaceae bacterium]
MRKIINSTYITLDGVVEQPHMWPRLDGRPGDPRKDTVQTDLLLACDAVLMGRRTYEGFAPAWQARSGDPMSDRMNTIAKYVVSTTLTNPGWANTTVTSNDPAVEIRKLKEQPGQDIVQYGFGAVSTLLMENNLLDELRLWFHPLFVGKGTSEDVLFPKAPPTQFELIDSAIFKDGMAILTCRVA